MKLVRFERQATKGIGVLTGDGAGAIPVEEILGGKSYDGMVRLIEEISEEELALLKRAALEMGSGTAGVLPLSEVRLLSPIERPVHDIICVGVNYFDHLEETKESAGGFEKAPRKPVYFGKRAHRILGTGEDVCLRADLDEALDYEVELAVIIGKTGKDISAEDAEQYIFGYSVFNDISSRGLQMDHVQWYRGKSLDGCAAMGPALLHKSALPLPVEVDVKSYVNDELRQSSNTKLLLTGIAAIVAELSAGMTLEAGDIIATGTPAGVGMGFQPPRYLKAGDRVICEIPEIGKLINGIK